MGCRSDSVMVAPPTDVTWTFTSVGVFPESIGSGTGARPLRRNGLRRAIVFFRLWLGWARVRACAREDLLGTAPTGEYLAAHSFDFINGLRSAIARSWEYNVGNPGWAAATPRVGPDAKFVGQSDRSFPKRADIRKDG
jgi:hypothetical protein